MITVYPPLELPRGGGGPAFPFDRPNLRLTHLGRGAVWLALRALGLGAGSRVAMPAYHCGSEVEAARLAGVDVAFYRDEEDLHPVASDVDAVYVISHFGFPAVVPPPGARVILDAAHALFTEGLCAADATIFCPRKSLGVPDGGAVLTEAVVDAPPGRAPGGRIARSAGSLVVGRGTESRLGPVRAGARTLLRRVSRADAAAERGELTEVVIGEWDLSVDDMQTAARRPSRFTEWAVVRADAASIRSRRRANYERLVTDLADVVPERYRVLPDGVCPLYVPVVATDRARAIRDLLARGVRAIEVWPVPHPLLDRDRFAELEPMRRNLLALPVHQLLTEDQLDTVRRAAVAALLEAR